MGPEVLVVRPTLAAGGPGSRRVGLGWAWVTRSLLCRPVGGSSLLGGVAPFGGVEVSGIGGCHRRVSGVVVASEAGDPDGSLWVFRLQLENSRLLSELSSSLPSNREIPFWLHHVRFWPNLALLQVLSKYCLPMGACMLTPGTAEVV